MANKRATTAEELKNRIYTFVEIKHPNPAIGELRFRIKRGLPTGLIMTGKAQMPNPLLAALEDKKGTEAPAADGLDFVRGIAAAALIEPTYAEIEDFIKDDLFILGVIAKEATGIRIISDNLAGNLFRAFGSEPANATE